MSTEDASNKTEETATVAEPPTVLPYDPTPTDTVTLRLSDSCADLIDDVCHMIY